MNLQKPSKERLIRDGKNFLAGSILCAICLFVTDRVFGSVCWLRLAFGIPCPLCGMTRATGLFLRGDFSGAWKMHALFYLVLLFVPFYIFCKYFVENGSRMIWIYVIIFSIVAIGYYVYRMLYLFPGQEPLDYDPANWFNYIRKLLVAKGTMG